MGVDDDELFRLEALVLGLRADSAVSEQGSASAAASSSSPKNPTQPASTVAVVGQSG
jgi:hypothetical protein